MRFPGARIALIWGPPEHNATDQTAPWSCRLYALAPEIARVEEVGYATACSRAELAVVRFIGTLLTAAQFYSWRLTGSPPPEDEP